ncbi:MAG: anti-sigma factor [Bacteroidota bacterium]|nr:anti-sigma factor [Bacteroidota bacterium]
MNLENYISSGILESYVLGELTPSQNKEVEVNAEKYPEIMEELRQLELVFHEIAQSNSKPPKPGTKESLLSKIDSIEKEGKTESKQQDTVGSKIISMDSATKKIEKSSRGLIYWAAASAALALISTILAITFYSRWQNSENSLATVIAENSRLAEEYNMVNQNLGKAERDLAIINKSEFQRVELKGLEISPTSLARIYWNENSQEVYLNVAALPQPPADKQYQLWAIVNGQPVDAGVFNPHEAEGLLPMKNIANAAAFAVTLEPQGGSQSPTMELMYIHGTVNEA